MDVIKGERECVRHSDQQLCRCFVFHSLKHLFSEGCYCSAPHKGPHSLHGLYEWHALEVGRAQSTLS